jgi:hypothetical protein
MAMITPSVAARRVDNLHLRCCHAREGGHPVNTNCARGNATADERGDSEAKVPAEQSGLAATLDRTFGLNAAGSTVPIELRAGLATLSLFLAPLAQTVPPYATAPALLFVACLMATSLGAIQWDELTEYIPALTIALMIP